MLLSLALIGKMLIGHPSTDTPADEAARGEEQQDSEAALEWTEDTLAAMAGQALPFTADSLTVHIARDGTVSLEMTVSRGALLDSEWLPGGMRTALMFLPKLCTVCGAWATALQDGKLALECQSITAADFALPEAAARKLSDQLSGALNDQLAEQMQAPPQRMQAADGVLRFYA